MINVIAFGRDGRYRRCGIDKRNNDKYSEEYKKTRVEYFSDPSQYLAGKKGEHKRGKEECERKQEKIKPAVIAFRKKLFKSDRERGRRATGNRKKRSYCQIQQTGEKVTVRFACLTAQIKKPRTAAYAERRNSEQGKPNTCDEKTENRRPNV